MIDHHTHIGQYYNLYTEPSELVRIMDFVGMEYFSTSSTSICEGDYKKVHEEMTELIRLVGNRVLPVLWIIPQMFSDGGLQRFLDSNIPWTMLKIHPQLHPLAWQCGGRNMRNLILFAKKLQLPIMIHTGEFAGCYPSLFERAIRYNPSVTFILAHGRPLNETIILLQRYPNVFVDTAFMPVENIVTLCRQNLAHRVLWGTDVPIQLHYNQNESIADYYANRMKEVRETLCVQDYNTIMGNHI